MTTLSDPVRLLLLEECSADQLRHLAGIKDAREPRSATRRSLDRASAEELADLYLAGGRPTIGFFLRRSPNARVGTVESQVAP